MGICFLARRGRVDFFQVVHLKSQDILVAVGMTPIIGVFTVGCQIDLNSMGFPVFKKLEVGELNLWAVVRLPIVNRR